MRVRDRCGLVSATGRRIRGLSIRSSLDAWMRVPPSTLSKSRLRSTATHTYLIPQNHLEFGSWTAAPTPGKTAGFYRPLEPVYS